MLPAQHGSKIAEARPAQQVVDEDLPVEGLTTFGKPINALYLGCIYNFYTVVFTRLVEAHHAEKAARHIRMYHVSRHPA